MQMLIGRLVVVAGDDAKVVWRSSISFCISDCDNFQSQDRSDLVHALIPHLARLLAKSDKLDFRIGNWHFIKLLRLLSGDVWSSSRASFTACILSFAQNSQKTATRRWLNDCAELFLCLASPTSRIVPLSDEADFYDSASATNRHTKNEIKKVARNEPQNVQNSQKTTKFRIAFFLVVFCCSRSLGLKLSEDWGIQMSALVYDRYLCFR